MPIVVLSNHHALFEAGLGQAVAQALFAARSPRLGVSASAKQCFWSKAVNTWRQTIAQAEQHPSAPLTPYLFFPFNVFEHTASNDKTWRRLVEVFRSSVSPVTCPYHLPAVMCKSPQKQQQRRDFAAPCWCGKIRRCRGATRCAPQACFEVMEHYGSMHVSPEVDVLSRVTPLNTWRQHFPVMHFRLRFRCLHLLELAKHYG